MPSADVAPGPRGARPGRRVAALALDYVVVLGWMAVLAAASGVVAAVAGGYPDVVGALGPVGAQAVFASLLTVPVGLYLFLTESGPRHATWGKRRAGLAVAAADGGPPTRGQVAVRTVVKLLPWELAHTGVWQMQAAFARGGPDADVPAWVLGALVAANLAVVLYLAASLLGRRRGPHDRVARTVVTAPR